MPATTKVISFWISVSPKAAAAVVSAEKREETKEKAEEVEEAEEREIEFQNPFFKCAAVENDATRLWDS